MAKKPYCENCYANLQERDGRYWCPVCKDFRSPSPHSIEAADAGDWVEESDVNSIILDFPNQQDQLPFFRDAWDGVPPITLTQGDLELLHYLELARREADMERLRKQGPELQKAITALWGFGEYKRPTIRDGGWHDTPKPQSFMWSWDAACPEEPPVTFVIEYDEN